LGSTRISARRISVRMPLCTSWLVILGFSFRAASRISSRSASAPDAISPRRPGCSESWISPRASRDRSPRTGRPGSSARPRRRPSGISTIVLMPNDLFFRSSAPPSGIRPCGHCKPGAGIVADHLLAVPVGHHHQVDPAKVFDHGLGHVGPPPLRGGAAASRSGDRAPRRRSRRQARSRSSRSRRGPGRRVLAGGRAGGWPGASASRAHRPCRAPGGGP
jgi:hypothetical protein